MPSERQLLEYERVVLLDAEDVCARGQIIWHYPPAWVSRQTKSRVDHLVWMIQNHPEWDGFTANPVRRLADPRSAQERTSYNRLEQAWLKQIGPTQQNAIVLHNASMFFALHEPERAGELLKRAIGLDPHELVYVERLGMVYAFSLRPSGCVERDSQEFKAFAQQAKDALRRSDDWVLLAGALSATRRGCEPEEPDLYTRLQEVRPAEDPWSLVDKLPSRSSTWCRSKCVPAPFEGR